MKLLLDTHVLLWASGFPERLSEDARALIEAPGTDPVFSAASLWEVTIKNGLGRADFEVDPCVLHRELLANGCVELPVTGAHAIIVDLLPSIYKDPLTAF